MHARLLKPCFDAAYTLYHFCSLFDPDHALSGRTARTSSLDSARAALQRPPRWRSGRQTATFQPVSSRGCAAKHPRWQPCAGARIALSSHLLEQPAQACRGRCGLMGVAEDYDYSGPKWCAQQGETGVSGRGEAWAGEQCLLQKKSASKSLQRSGAVPVRCSAPSADPARPHLGCRLALLRATPCCACWGGWPARASSRVWWRPRRARTTWSQA